MTQDSATYGETTTTILSMTRRAGIAGSFSYVVKLRYVGPDWQEESSTVLHGFENGGPIVAEFSGRQLFVSSAVLDRLGRNLDPAWIRGYFLP